MLREVRRSGDATLVLLRVYYGAVSDNVRVISPNDDAEVVGDLVAVDMPVPRHLLAQKSQHRSTKILEPSVAFVVGAVPVHQSPQSFEQTLQWLGLFSMETLVEA